MNRTELKAFLQSQAIDSSAYDLDDTWKNDSLVLADDGGGWTIYYRERGERRPLAFCGTEAEACERFLGLLRKLAK